jgi:hypothetical protein
MEEQPAVAQWRRVAAEAPAIEVYDNYVRGMGGEILVSA